MFEILKFICYVMSVISVLGLVLMHHYFLNEKKNILDRFKQISNQINELNKKIENYKLFISKDITNWANLTRTLKSTFKVFEERYIHHQSKINNRLQKLEKND